MLSSVSSHSAHFYVLMLLV